MNKAIVIGVVAVLVVAIVGSGAYFVMTSKKTVTQLPVEKPLNIPVQSEEKIVAPQTSVNQIKLVVLKPTDKSVVTTPNLVVSGQTTPNADVAINEITTKANSAGNFSVNIILAEGDNPIIIDAFDADGNTSEQELNITYQLRD